jgi:hypothetical protein
MVKVLDETLLVKERKLRTQGKRLQILHIKRKQLQERRRVKTQQYLEPSTRET